MASAAAWASVPQGLRTQSAAAAGAGRAVEVLGAAEVRGAHLHPLGDGALVVGPQRPRRARVGRRHVGPLGPLALPRELALPERGDHGEDLLTAEVRQHTSLAGGVAAHDLAHLELHDVGWPRELEELRGGPHRAPSRDVFEDGQRRAEPAAAEQRTEAGADRAHDGKAPRVAARVVLQPVEGECVHAARMLGADPQHAAGERAGVLTVFHEHLAGDDRAVVAARALREAARAVREVVSVLGYRQCERVEVDHVQVGDWGIGPRSRRVVRGVGG